MIHRTFWFAPVALSLAACQSPGANAPKFDARALAAEEAKFAAHSMQHGMQPAFVEFMAPGSVLLRPDPVDGREFMKKRPNPPIELDWKSAFTILSASGELGLSTGPWIRKSKTDKAAAPLWGQFFSIWRKQADGQWRVEFDHGISHAGHDGMKEALTAIDLARADGNVNANGAPAPETDFIAAAKREGALAAYQKYRAAKSRLLRDETVPIVDSAPSIAITDAESRYDWTPIKTVNASAGDFSYVLGKWKTSGNDKPETGYYLRVWVRSGKEWKLAAELVTPDPKP
jgi:ketosteroid isomerase-like protein